MKTPEQIRAELDRPRRAKLEWRRNFNIGYQAALQWVVTYDLGAYEVAEDLKDGEFYRDQRSKKNPLAEGWIKGLRWVLDD